MAVSLSAICATHPMTPTLSLPLPASIYRHSSAERSVGGLLSLMFSFLQHVIHPPPVLKSAAVSTFPSDFHVVMSPESSSPAKQTLWTEKISLHKKTQKKLDKQNKYMFLWMEGLHFGPCMRQLCVCRRALTPVNCG